MSRMHSIFGLIVVLLLVPGAADAQDETSYGYVRTLEGSATITRADTGKSDSLLLNYPLQVGDRLQTDPYAAVELVLADFNVVRIAGDAEIWLPELAFSADSSDRRTVLSLLEGELQLVVTEYALGDELPRIETENATVFLHEPGTYVVEFDSRGWTRLVVRSGYAEVSTERGSAIARAEEEVLVEGLSRPGITVLAAGPRDSLEAWGEALTAAAAEVEGVDPALGYSASTLQESGEWVDVEGSRAWRPYVEVSWRPFTTGTWVTTPSGFTWVGHEPWGWVTGHYGYWSQHSHWGWIWYPGFVYSPAHVYWYWGAGWVGWVPTGYYGSPHYGNHFYGYVGGHWSHYRHWTFCPTVHFGHRRGHRHHYGGHEMATRTGRPAVPRGVIATETSGISRVEWRDGGEVERVLTARARRDNGERVADLTDFVVGRSDRPPGTRPPVDRPTDRSDVVHRGSGPDGPLGIGVADTGPGNARSDISRQQSWRSSDDGRRVVVRDSRTRGLAETRTRSSSHRDLDETADRGWWTDDRRGWRSGRDTHGRSPTWRDYDTSGSSGDDSGTRYPGSTYRGSPYRSSPYGSSPYRASPYPRSTYPRSTYPGSTYPGSEYRGSTDRGSGYYPDSGYSSESRDGRADHGVRGERVPPARRVVEGVVSRSKHDRRYVYRSHSPGRTDTPGRASSDSSTRSAPERRGSSADRPAETRSSKSRRSESARSASGSKRHGSKQDGSARSRQSPRKRDGGARSKSSPSKRPPRDRSDG